MHSLIVAAPDADGSSRSGSAPSLPVPPRVTLCAVEGSSVSRLTTGERDLVGVGVDACPGGWVLATLRGSEVKAAYIRTIGELVRASMSLEPGRFGQGPLGEGRLGEGRFGLGRFGAVGVDIPIGLVEAGHRAADLAGRQGAGGEELHAVSHAGPCRGRGTRSCNRQRH